MKHVIAFTLLLALGAVALLALGAAAQANLAPVERQPVAIAPDDSAVSTRAAGATFEQDYFRAPPPPAGAAGRVFLCRPQQLIFNKTRLAQLCH
jgi:hypothetical protein